MPLSSLHNEPELLRRIATGDERAFNELFKGYYPALARAVYPILESPQLTQEVVQDTFVKVWLKRAGLAAVENFTSYLFIICRNQAFAALRKLARERRIQPAIEQELLWDAELDGLDNPAEAYRALIARSVAKLPAQQQRIYQLSRYEHLKYEEIARQLELSPDTVKTQIYKAVKFIKQDLEPHLSAGLAVVLTTAVVLGAAMMDK
jgi:RNA polymerase sigma-70 factor (ECF subfamily)